MQQDQPRLPTSRLKMSLCRLACAHFIASALISSAFGQDTVPIQWIDLLPATDKAAFQAEQKKLVDIPPLPDLGALTSETDSSWLDRKPIGSNQVANKHRGQRVALTGYPAPLAAAAKNQDTLSFLLVPELGAGLYLPAPPPNQTVRVNLPPGLAEQKKSQPAPDKPIRIVGQLTPSNDSNASYAYIIDAVAWDW